MPQHQDEAHDAALLSPSAILDLPTALLSSLVLPHLDANTLLALLGTCRGLRDAAVQLIATRLRVVAVDQRSSLIRSRPSIMASQMEAGACCADEGCSLEASSWPRTCLGTPVYVHRRARDPHGSQPGNVCLACITRHASNLVTLDLRWAFSLVDDSTLALLARHAPATLRHLVLEQCNGITAAGVQALCRPGGALAGTLRSLVLRSCGDVGDGAALAGLQALSALDCAWCTSITSAGLYECAERLQAACLRGCDGVDDRLCPALAQAARHLDLAFTRVGDPGLRNLMSPGGPLNTLVLAQPIANIYVTGTFTAACVAQLMAERPGVVVRLVSA